jgi:sulfur-oxidizing protein SoxX
MRLQEFFFAFVTTALVAACQPPSAEEEAKSTRGFALPDGDAARGKEAFVALRCSSCHEVAGLEDELPRPTANPQTGIKLGGLAMREPTDGELVTSIIDPSHQISPAAPPGEEERVLSGTGSRMANLNGVMTVQQLIDIVAFLHERYQTRPG